MATARSSVPDLEEYKRRLDAMPLPEVWSIVTRAWLARRRRPECWRLIANNVHLVGGELEGLGKDGA